MHRAGYYYHIYNRGCNREPIFLSPANYTYLLRQAARLLRDCPVAVIAYCLMPNHYHLLLRPEKDGAVSPFLQRLFGGYTQALNRQHARTGTLFEGRARTIFVDTEPYVLHLCRYIHLNPVKAGLARRPEDWPHSNYLEWIGRRRSPLVDLEFVRQYFPTSEDYRAFVLAEMDRLLEDKLATYCFD